MTTIMAHIIDTAVKTERTRAAKMVRDLINSLCFYDSTCSFRLYLEKELERLAKEIEHVN